jgi:hypothetical protein
MQSVAFKHALCDHSQMLAFNEGLAHNLGAAWRRFFKIADRVQARGPGFEGCLINEAGTSGVNASAEGGLL